MGYGNFLSNRASDFETSPKNINMQKKLIEIRMANKSEYNKRIIKKQNTAPIIETLKKTPLKKSKIFENLFSKACS
ncbi:Uncharacterised protein [Helicobacter fennelliae]|uniref:Uncharacterized protein n=2 Tax=Helicobacter fennelliae TaxID=215 RepID=T1DX95_9HELI|nr:hypothetical protein HFN_1311 [Helicobacter fennelliae MRY12-0050]SQB98244.1 Uncharacterised protein [Helicobacter fennelliae]STP07780.1 Uncharacterised protein [Helicobacter fennelliae]STQ84536.1 Uncharacterised protein [Helicobacter fennelliae]